MSFLTFFLHTLWTFMSSKAVWLLSHVVCPGECMEGKKSHLNPKLYSYIISVSAPLQSDPYESSTLSWPWGFWHSDNIGAAERIYLSIIQHLLKITVGELRLGLVKTLETLEFNNVFHFHDRLVYIRLSSSLSVKILSKMEWASLIFLFIHYCCF